MGEGNWKVARKDRPIRLVDRELGIGGLSNPPTTVFQMAPGVATTANLVPLEGEAFRLLVARGDVLDVPDLPNVAMPYYQFRPESGLRPFLDDWLRLGGTHHFVANAGDHVNRWRRLAELLDLDYHEV
jgi:L-arabinose isomerase